ncbi:bifunctional UDP-4-amino-4-deoxy-L-arabinose formyltransferase/UDP-glucuronic acid oxidase ArnA [Thorsellia anophelis]|uniref:UDP-4-amino-4-deoxy-L-arabinose formyltransferase / UDP-glucuronic acid dehydrogenase (UDP-4-keto-hexauronic acid decarboxylating) n=1 Tax=Thorsellia anophelis DSM 18579 TaxID=1123402 RepID=A0A1I0BP23_9GAMM|nr:bifunctional UDP-4-amino-4-deoxy-L-arabinose formyltransferase/UDP-glucuronic acid oxidase ArnA [Thorsellia anophelis]SET08379.1 UDP-4-amino-4-deoxy-L-arabinose formyltransferase / UDP-glucuronic acid dehydrogenase (UDP-4-keto-hexauronic acid decarboxylating) [Thorsellia anophelis DSM 18579]
MKNRAVVFAYHTIGCTGIESLIKAGFEIITVFTHKDSPNEHIYFESVAKKCAEHNLMIFAPDTINTMKWESYIAELNPDYIFSFYYREKISMNILELAKIGTFNLHGSLLPHFRGCAPLNWAIIKGASETGVTIHHMTDRLDAGEIVAQQKIPIDINDTARSLLHKMNIAAELLLDRTLPKIKSRNYVTISQQESQASYFPRRKPEDGLINWDSNSLSIYNLIRGVSAPYPGAFTFYKNQKIIIWEAALLTHNSQNDKNSAPGTILSTDPLIIATLDGSLEVKSCQIESLTDSNNTPITNIWLNGNQLAKHFNLNRLDKFGPVKNKQEKLKTVLIIGVNGFIGQHLATRLLADGNYRVHGVDINDSAIASLKNDVNFRFYEADILLHKTQIEFLIKSSDIVFPLVAIATPESYTKSPLTVFELDFEANLEIIRHCVKYQKRIIFPSTSEVYGMCNDEKFNEENSNLIMGPISKQRWIYASSKQLLDRVIWAYGSENQLQFTLFRPFNWMGPGLDSLELARQGKSRAITKMIANLVDGEPIALVEGGLQKRCFTDIEDGINALIAIIENHNGLCDGQIINIGNPENEASIAELANRLVNAYVSHPLSKYLPKPLPIKVVDAMDFYGQGYQDVDFRKPDISQAKNILHWTPEIALEQTLKNTLDHFLRQAVKLNKNQSSYEALK